MTLPDIAIVIATVRRAQLAVARAQKFNKQRPSNQAAGLISDLSDTITGLINIVSQVQPEENPNGKSDNPGPPSGQGKDTRRS